MSHQIIESCWGISPFDLWPVFWITGVLGHFSVRTWRVTALVMWPLMLAAAIPWMTAATDLALTAPHWLLEWGVAEPIVAPAASLVFGATALRFGLVLDRFTSPMARLAGGGALLTSLVVASWWLPVWTTP